MITGVATGYVDLDRMTSDFSARSCDPRRKTFDGKDGPRSEYCAARRIEE
jgi:hypothetical protein